MTEPTTSLSAYVHAIGEEDIQFAEDCAAQAALLIANFIGTGNPYQVPTDVVGRAVLEVGADLYYRRSARNGIVGLEGDEPTPMRLNRDPMQAAYPLLRPYLVTGL